MSFDLAPLNWNSGSATDYAHGLNINEPPGPLTTPRWRGVEGLNGRRNFLPWEWQVSDKLILVGYALFIKDFHIKVIVLYLARVKYKWAGPVH